MTLRFVPSAPAPGAAPAPDALRPAQSGRAVDSAAASALIGTGAAEAGVRALVEGRALAVTTGQQAGLFTGPAYTIYKALTAATVARTLGERWGLPVVPVHWVAGDDHDFTEIDHCAVIAVDGAPVTIRLREREAHAPLLPAYRELLGPEVETALESLAAALPASEARDETLAWLREAYRPERSLAEAHALALAALLGPLGVVVARGWDGGLKRAASEVLLGAARRAAAIEQGLVARSRELEAAGLPVPVEVGDGLSLLLVEGRLGRDRLRIEADHFVTRRGGERFTLSYIEALLESEPQRLSANVLLRPVVEAAVFPTVGYVGGPGELAYLRQSDPVFEALEVPRPARLPRLSGFIVDARVDKVLARYGLEPGDFARPEGELTSRVAREALPQSALRALEQLRAAVVERYAALQAEAAAIDRTLERTVETARNSALVGSQEIEKKLVAALKRQGDQALQQITRTRQALFPGGQPQERVLSWASFAGRFGSEVLELVKGAAERQAALLLDGPRVRV